MGLVASRHVDQIRVPCIERWILNYWTIGEVSLDLFFNLLICLLLLFGCTASSLRLSGFSLVAESGGCFLAAERRFQAHGLQWSHHVAQQLWHTCLVVPLHGESSWTGAEPVSLALGRRILILWTTGEVFHGFLNRHRYDCLPLAPRFMSTHHVCLHSSCRESLDSRILLFPDSLLNQTWWYVQRGNSHKHLSLLHLRVPNPDIDSCWCSLVTVMDLCSAFFPPLIPDSPFLSAIMFRGRQSTWTHVSQGLCEIIFPSL